MIRLGQRPPLRAYLAGIWKRRQFAAAIAAGEVRSQNMDTALGNVWHVMNPLLLAAVYYLVFGVILDISRGVDNFIAFLVIGIFSYHYSQKSIIAAAKSIVANEGLIRSLQFPRAVLPISTVAGHTIAFGPAVVIMLTIALVTGELPQLAWLLLLPLFAVQSVFNVGAGFIAARLTDRYRDVENVLPYLFRLGFYMSGVLYSVDRFVPDQYRVFFDFNPFFVFITIARDLVLHGTLDPSYWLIGLGWTLALVLVGLVYFRNAEHRYGRG